MDERRTSQYVHLLWTLFFFFAQRAAEKFAKKLLGDNDVQAVLGRLDRLTQEESRATAVQTLQVIHGLVNNMTVVMEGAHSLFIWPRAWQ
jgi:hypothetical protein